MAKAVVTEVKAPIVVKTLIICRASSLEGARQMALEEPSERATPFCKRRRTCVVFKEKSTLLNIANVNAAVLPVPDSVMRPKALAGDGASGAISEAEALRKDPFKNYKDV